MNKLYWNREDIAALLCESIHEQTEIDNTGDTETILFMQKDPTLNPMKLLDSFFAKLGMKIEEPS